jgi:phosphoribosylanthranilate isomerase
MTKVKICGITNLEDALTSVRYGADMLGFNFYEKSPRYVAPNDARNIAENVSDNIWKIGVFVNMEPYRIDEFVSHIGLDAVQLHGDEDAGFVDKLRGKTSAKIIKAVRIRRDADSIDLASNNADLILLDTLTNQYGGSGTVFDWSILDQFGEERTNLILAGGLTPANVADAVKTMRPYAVDVASGVESSPGKKDPDKVSAFIRAAKQAV